MASRESSASDGEVLEAQQQQQQKAITNNQPAERTINKSNRAFGLDRPDYASKLRDLSRSPSPYRHKPSDSRSPSPYRRNRNVSRSPSPYRRRSPSPYRNKRVDSRSPSPYRRPRNVSRSPSPYRRGRADGAGGDSSSRSQPKRKGSPPRGVRPEKRHQTDRSRHNDRPPRSQLDNVKAMLQSNPHGPRQPDRPSYARHENSNQAHNNREGMSGQNGRRDHQRIEFQQASEARGQSRVDRYARTVSAPTNQTNDIEMKSPQPVHDSSHEEATDEKAPPQETREEKRRRWAAIRAAAEREKPKENLLQQALLANASEGTTPAVASPAAPSESSVSPSGSPHLGHLDSVPASPDVMMVDKQGGVDEGSSPAAETQSAADYDPTKDMLDDRDRAAKKAQQSEMSANAYSETNPRMLSTLPAEKVTPVKKQKKDFDMFDFDSDEDVDHEQDTVEATVEGNTKGVVLDEKLLDNWDDPEGYYKIISNELVNDGRYRMIKGLGRGVFANVAQAEDIKTTSDDGNPNLVAIKIIRRNDLMRVASQKEMDFVRKVNDADPNDKRFIVRLFSSFEHKGHLCGVFEHMSKNLRDLLKEDTSSQGITLQAVRVYARQMFIGLWHLQNCQVVHCDLKPDNILVSHDRKTIKLCDFGTAVDKRDIMDRTEYLVSRFYRAPEIILGMDIGYGIDMWAIGCTLYELWTGKILFTGRTNNQMVKAFMDCLGWPTEKLLKKGLLNNVLEHFEAGPPLVFISREVDQHGNVSVRKIEQQKKIPRDLRTRINDANRDVTDGPGATELNDFAELLGACLNLNVEKRMQPKDALQHRFFPQPKAAPKKPMVKPPIKSSVVKPLVRRGGATALRR